ncbi:hypothetical protein MYSTI_01908 [Myxococcus stipitatus DSM 14675]|uniref:Uncharacterized protein n=1 Tax=Myxococcus stipitatus (strain DSM 14675 / JCM 12634 / Mx s8) TaxID=1278073 RepID=L7U9U4_MYXSD|nr:hypothetical protein [Myxococcus stipitatus]AGC43239.1 hypothetical protein MYSTI_01908 [Myxococcus stipitatus DSM 14675]
MNRRILITAALTVPCAVLGYGLGRLTATTPEPEVVVQEEVVYQDRVRVVTVREAAEVQTRVVYRDRLETPDGTVRVREVERADTARVERAEVATAAERTVDVHRVETPAPAPAWRASLLVGVPVRLNPSPVLVGGHIQRRLWGPVSAGAWTLIPTGPGAPATAGVSLSVEW